MQKISDKNYWVISDTHFNHENILRFTDTHGKPVRPFSSVQDMNETIIDNWNNSIKPQDIVYHLGDVCFGNKDDYIHTIHPRLNGKKRLILGNHDHYHNIINKFQKVFLWRHWKEFGLILSHVPIREDQWRHSVELNIHGHMHQKGSPEGPYKSVCVEMTNYKPINLEEIRVK